MTTEEQQADFERGEAILRTLMIDLGLDPALAPTLWTRLYGRLVEADLLVVLGADSRG